MEFWGVEAKPGQTLDCDPGEEKYIHLSQLAIGENAKENERVSVYVHFEGKKIMLGTFTHGTCDQIGLDLVFEKKFQISHTSKNTAVFCTGYTTYIQEEDDEYPSYSDSEDEEEMVEAAFPTKENGGKLVPKALKTDSKEAKQEAKDAKQAVAKPGKADKGSNGKPQAAKPPTKEAVRDEEDSDDEDDDDSENDEDSEDEATQDASESDEDVEDDEDDDDSDEEEEETPKVKDGKKRLAPNSAAKTPVTDKKAKLITPEGQKQDNVAAREYWDSLVLAGKKKQEGDAKKNVHVATPHPGAKQGGKKGKETPGTSKPQTPAKQTPKSATPGSGKMLGQFTCQPCKRNFNTETGLTSHNAAKHGEK